MKAVHEAFDCGNCGTHVLPLHSGTRNHCTDCLCSAHVDGKEPGDRSESCHGIMHPIAIETRKGLQYILHECSCGHTRSNKVAPDDNLDTIITVMQSGNVDAQAKNTRA